MSRAPLRSPPASLPSRDGPVGRRHKSEARPPVLCAPWALPPPHPETTSRVRPRTACLRRSHTGTQELANERGNKGRMANTRDKLINRARRAKPYIERAFQDEDLRDNVNATKLARVVYNELIGGRGAIPVATRVATDKDIQDHLREALDELRQAADRVQGKKDHGSRNTMLLLTVIALLQHWFISSPGRRRASASVPTASSVPSDEFTYQGGNSSPSSSSTTSSVFRVGVVGPHDQGRPHAAVSPGRARRRSRYRSPSSTARVFGAFPSERNGAHASPPAKLNVLEGLPGKEIGRRI